MRYTVILHPIAEHAAAVVRFAAGHNAAAVYDAVHTLINRTLRHDPAETGVPVEDEPGLRGWTGMVRDREFYVTFRIDEGDRKVIVDRVTVVSPPKD